MRKRKFVKYLSILLIITGLILAFIEYILYPSQKEISQKELTQFLITNPSYDNYAETPKGQLAMILEINTLNLRYGIYPIDSPLNDVDQNVAIHKNSDTPNIAGGNTLLIAHSGTSKVAFFNDIESLQKNDEITIYYQGYKYTYHVTKKILIPKTGSYTNKETGTILTLITCDKQSKDKQLVIISTLTSKELY